MNWVVLGSLLLFIASVYTLRLILIIPCFTAASESNKDGKDSSLLKLKQEDVRGLQLFIFLGSGGHTGEMLRLLQNYKNILLNKDTTLHVGYSDNESLKKMKKLSDAFECKVKFYEFKKAREVGANVKSSLKTIIVTLLASLMHVVNIKLHMLNKPHLVLLNGPGTCCIITTWFKLIDLLCLFTSSNIIYVESLARIKTLSLTGKILYWLADEFVVQWKDLQTPYPRSKHFGILV
ncbi:UDP-N-acetylglucosamine transferase subunit Alg14p [Monosporozyma unispora]|nr:UDP-N-acetylglucosamine transferase subunit [Kazachstania unispora]